MALNNYESGSWFSNFGDAFDVVSGTPTINTTGGRWLGRCPQFELAGGTSHGFGWGNLGSGVDERVIQFAFYLTNAVGASQLIPIVRAMEGGISHCELCVNPISLKFRFTRNVSTALGAAESALGFALNTWYYAKVRIKVHDSAGTVRLLLTGGPYFDTEIINLTGLDTRNAGAVGEIDRVLWGNHVGTGGGTLLTVRYQDMEVCDLSGSAPMNDFHDEGKVILATVNAAGDLTEWDPTPAVANHLNLDEIPNDGDTSFNSTDTTGDTDLFQHSGIGTPTTIHGLKITALMGKDTGGTDTVCAVIKTGGTIYEGPHIAVVGAAYVPVSGIWELNPDTAAPFTPTEINSDVQPGYRRVS